MVKEEYKYSDITEKTIGCAMKVHSTLGNGFQACLPKGSTARRQEVIYQRCLQLAKAGSKFLSRSRDAYFLRKC